MRIEKIIIEKYIHSELWFYRILYPEDNEFGGGGYNSPEECMEAAIASLRSLRDVS
jgi:hypothetical protein